MASPDHSQPYTLSARRRWPVRLATVLKRRGWVLILCVVLVAAVAYAVDKRTPTSFTAQAVLVVPATTGTQAPPGNADGAEKLATTYVVMIPLDDQVVGAIATKLGITSTQVRKALTVTNDTNSAILRVNFQASTAREAVAGAAATSAILTSANPPGEVASGSLRSVQAPTVATVVTGTSATTPAVGALLGFLLGLLILVALERSDRRVDDLAALGSATNLNVSYWRPGGPDEGAALVQRLGDLSGRPVPVLVLTGVGKIPRARVERIAYELAEQSTLGGVPARVVLTAVRESAPARESVKQKQMRRIAEVDAAPGGTHLDLPISVAETRVLPSGRLGFGEGAELAVANGDVAVLVVARGARAADVTRAREWLNQYGNVVGWALLVPSRAPRA